jgi:hypothetical protein
MTDLNFCTFNFWDNSPAYLTMVFDALEELGYNLKEVNNSLACEFAIEGTRTRDSIQNSSAIKVLYSAEPREVSFKGYDLGLGYEFRFEDNYMRLPNYYNYFGKLVSLDYERGECDPNKPYFACFLVSNAKNGDGAVARAEMFHNLSLYKPLISGGKYLNNIGRIISKEESFEFLSQCKFILAYENRASLPGYITEKLFQAYYAKGLPIYYAHKTVLDDFNVNATIYAQNFNSTSALIDYIKQVDQDDKKYCSIWKQKLINKVENSYEMVKDRLKKKLRMLF